MPEVDPRLTAHAATLGDPAAHFIDERWREHPLVVRHGDGVPVFAIVGDALVPWDRYRPTQRPAAPEPARPGTPGSVTIEPTPPGFHATVEVKNS